MDVPRDYKRAAKRYRDAQASVETARQDLFRELQKARNAGVTLDLLAAELGVTRQRILQILQRH